MRIRLFRYRSSQGRRGRWNDAPVQPTRRVRCTTPPTWMTQPTEAFPRPGRAGWLTPAQTWRANGGQW